MRLIDADALSRAMYHEAFETDSDWQRWDSGLWIRYKMFENALKNAPTIDAEAVVRCKDCNHLGSDDGMPFCYMWMREIENEYEAFCSYGLERESEE